VCITKQATCSHSKCISDANKICHALVSVYLCVLSPPVTQRGEITPMMTSASGGIPTSFPVKTKQVFIGCPLYDNRN
jgi:hypothetical protein